MSIDASSSLNEMSDRRYLRWDTKGVEDPPPGEQEDIKAVAEQINTQQCQQFDNHRHVYTGTHCRTHGIVKGTFIVHDGLPPHLAQGELFSQAAEYPAACRYSTEPGAPGFSDTIPAPRGFSMKLFNVGGDSFPTGADVSHPQTQDIEFNSTPAIELADAQTTREIFDIRMGLGTLLETKEMNQALENRNDTELQKARFQVPNAHLASLRQYSQTAYRFGDYVFKYCLVPNTEMQKKLADQTIKPESHESDQHHNWLQNFHANHDAEYLFQVQLLENLDEQPVEYAGTEWDSEKYPWQTVATLRIPKQEAFDLERKAFWEDHMRLDPWHGLKSYQPLGSSNRLRKVVYPASSALRRKMNGRKEIWVRSIDEIPN
ncbi:putative catalase core domain, Catalase superfamily [Septoria linicola]|nr:putative catalase core domain, Catalase superfamily [Septoria linicola]